MNETSLNDLNYARFSAVAGATFQVSDGNEEPVLLKLVEVNQRQPRPADSVGRGESFSLLFAGAKTRLLPQKLYSFTHETLGRFPLFIVPVGQDATTFRYEAVFNRIRAAAETGGIQ